MNELFKELGRRNVFRVAGAYAVMAWLLSQVAVTLETSLELPKWFDSLIVSVLIIGFPIALLLAWAFEITPKGVKRTESVDPDATITAKTGQVLDYALLGGLALVAMLVSWQLVTSNAPAFSSETLSDSAVQTTIREQSIAVLPFENFSADPDQDYFASGISEELLNALARTEGMKVSSRTSAFAFKGTDTPINEIAEALSVAHVVEGSVRKSGTTLRITAQLIDADTDESLWSETYDRNLTADNIFAIQDEITTAIVQQLQGQISFAPAPTDYARTTSTEAYELYLRARENREQRQPDTLNAAVNQFEAAIELDPNFALAYAGLAETHMLRPEHMGADFEEMVGLAKPLLEKAQQLAPNAAEVLAPSAALAGQLRNYDEAIALADRAIAANPNSATAYHRKGRALAASGRRAEAIVAFQLGLQNDPLSMVILTNIAYSYLEMGDFENARATAEEIIDLNPESVFGYLTLGDLHYRQQDWATAHRHYKNAQARNPEYQSLQFQLFNIYVFTGLFETALDVDPSAEAQLFVYVYSGDLVAAQDLVESENLDDGFRSFVAYAKGEFAQNISLNPQDLTDYTDDRGKISSDFNAQFVAKFAYMYRMIGSSDQAAAFATAVEEYLGDRQPETISSASNLVAGAIMQLVKGDQTNALRWLERRVELQFADNFHLEPIYDDLRDLPEFIEIKERNDAILARHRAEIEAQLANPKSDWVFPDYSKD